MADPGGPQRRQRPPPAAPPALWGLPLLQATRLNWFPAPGCTLGAAWGWGSVPAYTGQSSDCPLLCRPWGQPVKGSLAPSLGRGGGEGVWEASVLARAGWQAIASLCLSFSTSQAGEAATEPGTPHVLLLRAPGASALLSPEVHRDGLFRARGSGQARAEVGKDPAGWRKQVQGHAGSGEGPRSAGQENAGSRSTQTEVNPQRRDGLDVFLKSCVSENHLGRSGRARWEAGHGLGNGPKDPRSSSLELANVTLFGKKTFAHVTKIRILNMGGLSWIIWVGPKCCHECPSKRSGGRGDTHRGGGDMSGHTRDHRSRDWSDGPSQEGRSHQELEDARNSFSPRAWRGRWGGGREQGPAGALISAP